MIDMCKATALMASVYGSINMRQQPQVTTDIIYVILLAYDAECMLADR